MIEAHVEKRLHRKISSRSLSNSSHSLGNRCRRTRSILRAVGPYLLFTIYCVCGGVLFYYIEHNIPLAYDNRAKNQAKCIGGYGFWAAFFYVISACSTIGFGTIYACTTPTRILSVFYSIIGIPLVLIILSDIGKRMCKTLRRAYVPLYRWYQRRFQQDEVDAGSTLENNAIVKSLMMSLKQADESSGNEDDDIPDIPISLGIFLTLSCVMCCAVYYRRIENYQTAESIYYSFLTFVAGDFNTNKFKWAVPVYALIFLGFSMLSLTISIVQNNIDNLINRVKREVRRELRKQQIIKRDTPRGEQEPLKSPDEIINAIIKKHGAPWLANMIPQNQLETITSEVREVINQSDVEIQTVEYVPPEPATYQEIGVNCSPVHKKEQMSCTTPVYFSDAQINAVPVFQNNFGQTPTRSFRTTLNQTMASDRRECHVQTVPKLWASTEIQAKPESSDQFTTFPRRRTANRGVTAAPQTRTILMQFPKSRD